MRWQDTYAVGDVVEYDTFNATGRAWCHGTVVRKTRTGYPVVALTKPLVQEQPGREIRTYTMVADRKTLIRKLPKEPHV